MHSFLDQLYETAALLKYSMAKGDLIGVMQLEAQMGALLNTLDATGEGDDKICDRP